jgi:hypothetical protein
MSGIDQTDMSAPQGEGPVGVNFSAVDALCSRVDDDLRAEERRNPLLGLGCILAVWALALYVGDLVIRTLS